MARKATVVKVFVQERGSFEHKYWVLHKDWTLGFKHSGDIDRSVLHTLWKQWDDEGMKGSGFRRIL